MSQLEQFILQCYNNIALNKNLEVEAAIGYLDRRGVKPATVDLHKIGYCCSKDTIPDEVLFYGMDAKKKEKYKQGFDYYIRNKIIVPIYSEFDELVGFATRKPSFEKGYSWWNISFKKNQHLFLLDKARKNVFKRNKIYLVEGYMDALILMQEGLAEVVAVMGTKLSHRKIGLIARYCTNVCICLDSDQNNSGQKAQREFICALKDLGFCESISVINDLPIGEDPDVFVIKNGLKAFLELEKTLSEKEILEIRKKVSEDKKEAVC